VDEIQTGTTDDARERRFSQGAAHRLVQGRAVTRSNLIRLGTPNDMAPRQPCLIGNSGSCVPGAGATTSTWWSPEPSDGLGKANETIEAIRKRYCRNRPRVCQLLIHGDDGGSSATACRMTRLRADSALPGLTPERVGSTEAV